MRYIVKVNCLETPLTGRDWVIMAITTTFDVCSSPSFTTACSLIVRQTSLEFISPLAIRYILL